jgi:Flp pilus assembly protein TadB
MKKLMMLVVAGMFTVSAAAYACDGQDHAKAEKSAKVVKKDTTKDTHKDASKKS